MLSDSDAIKLMTAITEVNGGDFTEPGARLFAASLDDMSLDEALNAFAEWNKQPHEFGKVRPYDINRVVRRKRSALIPSEASIGELTPPGLSGDDLVLWRRRLIHGVTRGGETVEQANAAALDAISTPRIESAPQSEREPTGLPNPLAGYQGRTIPRRS